MENTNYSTRGQLILAAAQKLFLRYGFDETSLEMIITESGGSRRSIYSEFGNKGGLLIAVVKLQVAAQTSTLKNIDYSLEPELALTAICEAFITGFISSEMIALFRLVSHLTPNMPDLGMLVYENGPLTGHQPIIEYLEYLERQNTLSINDKKFAAHSLINMAKTSLHTQAILVPSIEITKEEISAQARKSVRLFLNAYR